ncbi:MAG: VWA domain-containing protein, partial [SAR324 cluster bacterium]|nr:VWA domain-containing protein [SAR324 cluster bacterium]
MRFESPWFLLLFLALPFWWWWLVKRNKNPFIHYSEVKSLASLAKLSWWSNPYILPALRCLTLILLIFALARPQTGRSFTEVLTEGVDIVLAVDTSGSMRALDLKLNDKHVTRLEVVQHVLEQFITNRINDRVGMVVFGEEAFTQAPLTHDHDLLIGFLDQTFIGMAGDATAIGSAIAVGTKRLKDLKAPSKILILMTDGENTAGKVMPLQAAEAAKELGIKIYTIGVGTRGKAPIAVDGL